MLPPFDDDGLLPEGTYRLTLSQLASSMLVVGPETGYPGWDADARGRLFHNLAIAVRQLRRVGIVSVCIGGSFVEDKRVPSDIDGYFMGDYGFDKSVINGGLAAELNAIGPIRVWDFNPRNWKLDPKSGERKSRLWYDYSIDLFPNLGQRTGVVRDTGEEFSFYALMRWSRRVKRARGVIHLEEE